MNEPLDDDDCRTRLSDPVSEEIKQLKSDKTALLMLLKDCKEELIEYQQRINRSVRPEAFERLEMLVQQIDEELKSE